MTAQIVIDTNIFIAAMARGGGANRKVLRACFAGDYDPLMSNALYLEFEDVLARDHIFERSLMSKEERQDLFDDFCSISNWIHIHYRWRPNLQDEADNHVIELAIAGGAKIIVTNNKKDFKVSDLIFPDVQILNAHEFLGQHDPDPFLIDKDCLKRN